MKRVNNLYEQISSIGNLELADRKARKGKKKNYGIKIHDRNKEDNILRLQKSLEDKTYKTSKYDVFKIYEPKERLIYRLPYYPDRICQHAIMNILEPIWVKSFTRDSYSCIKGKGIHGALYKMKKDIRDKEGTRYYLKMDIKKFYPSIEHTILKQIIRKKIQCRKTLWLIDGIIDSASGVPIGNYLSQYLANLYLTYLDHTLKRVWGAKFYYRYADDLIILSDNKEFLHGIRSKVQEYLKINLKLTLKGNYRIAPLSTGLDFIGYIVRHSHILMRKSIKKNFARKAKKTSDIKQLSAHRGWAKHCNSKHFLKKIAA